MESEADKQKTSRTSQPLVRFTSPDESLKRYNVELFNPATGKAKDALFEDIDFNLYKPGAKSFAFKTSESRIRFWIRIFLQRYYKTLPSIEGFRVTWQEQDAASDATICDRIVLHLYTLENNHERQVVSITIFVSTGTIFVQGKWFREYGEVEFPLLLELVNKLCNTDQTGADAGDKNFFTSTLPHFVEKISYVVNGETADSHQSNENGSQQGKLKIHSHGQNEKTSQRITTLSTPLSTPLNSSDFCKSMADDLRNMQPESLVYTPSKLKSLSTLRNSVAEMESDFVSFKMEIAGCLQSLESTLESTDSDLKDRIVQLQSSSKLHIRNLEDQNAEMRASNEKLMEEVSSLSLAVKKMQDQMNSMKKANNKLSDQVQTLQKNYELALNELEKLKAKEEPEEQQTDRGAEIEAVTTQPDIPSQSGSALQSTDNMSSAIPLQNRFNVLSEEPEQPAESNTPEITQDPVRPKIMRSTPETTQKKTAPVLILCDSNGKYLRLNKLCPRRPVDYHRCPTITSGNEIISQLPSDSPELVVIHTGTNDLEVTKTADHLAAQISDLITTTSKKFPSTKIMYSTILPRRDVPSAEILKVNSLIEKSCSRIANVHLIDHANLLSSTHNILHDQKHLNQHGVKLFAKNLKDAIHGRRQRTPLSHEAWHGPSMSSGRHRRESSWQNSGTTYAAAIQRPLSSATIPRTTPTTTVNTEHTQQRHSYAAALQCPAPTQTPDPAAPHLPHQGLPTQLQDPGQLMNISIPKKMLPLIQFFNNLV